MGVSFSQKQRYMKGKIPMKYWQEDMWPEVEEIFEKLNLDEQKGLDMFLAFCAMDTDCGGTVDIDECFAYVGGVRSRFTERIWHIDAKVNEEGEYQEGLSFQEFATVCWNYCTLSITNLAKTAFEVFDVEQANVLEKPDIEAMYRLVYDCEDHDENYVRQVPFHKEKGSITKEEFAEYMNKDRHCIQPLIDYQKRLKSKMGGYILWENLAGFRRRVFLVYDERSSSTAEALEAIMRSEDPNRKAKKLAADTILAEKKAIMEAKQNAAAEELRAMERADQEDKRRANLAAEDRFMKLYWVALDTKRSDFEDEEFLVDDVWNRTEKRVEMYDILDNYVSAADDYYLTKDQKELVTMIGEDEDHEARYKDYVKTPEGKAHYTHTLLTIALTEKGEEFEKVRLGMKKVTSKNNKEIFIENSLSEIEKKIVILEQNRIMIAAGALKSKAKAAKIRKVDFNEETSLMKSLLKKDEIKIAETKAKSNVYNLLKQKTIKKSEQFMEHRKEDRVKDIKRVEFEMATSYGSRITRYEFVYDRPNEKYVYINIDTMEVLHQKTAFCEMCDTIFDQSDKKCKNCDMARSGRNQLLYRPLGFKDIRID